MIQTPYSIHFSIRKKFTKTSNQYPSTISDPHPPQGVPDQPVHHDEHLREELTYARSEYVKLYNLYVAGKKSLEREIQTVLAKLSAKNERDSDLILKLLNQKLKP